MKRNLISKSLLGIGVSLAVLLLSHPVRGQGAQQGDAPARLTIKSDVLGEERAILVRTPPGYERNSERYPVLYLTDGESQMSHTISTVAFLARNGRIPEMIIVGITNTDRTRDLTPTNASMPIPGGRMQPFPTSGGADKFLKFIETELIPNVEGKYRVHPYRIFAGHSFGGLFAVHTMLSRPDLFNAYIVVSPSLNWDNEFEIKRAEEFFKAHKEWKKTVYVSLGNEPGAITASFNHFKNLLTRNQPNGFEWLMQEMSDEDHGSVVLRSHYAGLRKIFQDWQLKTDTDTGAVEGGWPRVEAHYKYLTDKYGYNIFPSEGLVNQLGYQLLTGGKLDEAIVVFKANVERNPNSPNVYDSLAEAYENNGRLDLARTNYEKAYTLGKQRNDPNTEIFKTNFERVSGKVKTDEGTKQQQK